MTKAKKNTRLAKARWHAKQFLYFKLIKSVTTNVKSDQKHLKDYPITTLPQQLLANQNIRILRHVWAMLAFL